MFKEQTKEFLKNSWYSVFALMARPGPSSCFVFWVFYITFLYCLHLTHHFPTLKWYLLKNTDSEAGAMAQGVPALPQSSTPGTLIRWLTTASDFSSRSCDLSYGSIGTHTRGI